MKNIVRSAFSMALFGALVLQGCANYSTSPDVYTAGAAQREETVRFGTLESVRAVKIQSNGGQPSGLGAVGGGALGAVAGSTIGGGTGSILTAIVGGIAGRGRGQRDRERRGDARRRRAHRAARQRRPAGDHAGADRRAVPRGRPRAPALERRHDARHALGKRGRRAGFAG